MNLKNVLRVELNKKLEKPHTCACCKRVYEVFPVAYICKYEMIWMDCECRGTMAIKTEKTMKILANL